MGREKLLITLPRSLTAGTVATMCARSTLLTSWALLCRRRSRFSFLECLHRRSICVHSNFINPMNPTTARRRSDTCPSPSHRHCVCVSQLKFSYCIKMLHSNLFYSSRSHEHFVHQHILLLGSGSAANSSSNHAPHRKILMPKAALCGKIGGACVGNDRCRQMMWNLMRIINNLRCTFVGITSASGKNLSCRKRNNFVD